MVGSAEVTWVLVREGEVARAGSCAHVCVVRVAEGFRGIFLLPLSVRCQHVSVMELIHLLVWVLHQTYLVTIPPSSLFFFLGFGTSITALISSFCIWYGIVGRWLVFGLHWVTLGNIFALNWSLRNFNPLFLLSIHC